MRPFLKWAGNKYQIRAHIQKALPNGKRLIEPFLGSGAVFLNTEYPRYLLSEINEDIVTLYQYLQKDGESFIEYCRQYFVPEMNKKEVYYEIRDKFNRTLQLKRKSAMFLYLNRHGYNGLCRYNSSGEYNVPFGLYDKPYFPQKEMHFFHEKSQDALITCRDFTKSMKQARKGDVVYCDPPYVPLSKTSQFTQYSQDGFSLSQQFELADMANHLSNRGVTVVISNHYTNEIVKAYQNAKIKSLNVQRTISAKGSSRVKVKELIAVFSAK